MSYLILRVIEHGLVRFDCSTLERVIEACISEQDHYMNQIPVLIIEDDPVVALDLELAFQGYGLDDVRTCKSIEDADREITLRAPKVAIVDLAIDCGTQSAEVAGRLIQLDCHVILLANFKEDIRNLPPSLGYCDVIEKPFRDADLRAKLQRVSGLSLVRATSLDVAPNIEKGTS